MSDLSLSLRWNAAINQVDIDEPVLGGDGGNANLATRQLAENVFLLKDIVDNHEVAENPHDQYALKADFNKEIAALNKRLLALEGSVGSGNVLGRLELLFSGSTGSFSRVNSTIRNVYITAIVNGDFNFVPVGRLAGSSISDFVCQPDSSSRVMTLSYPEGFSDELHEIRSNYIDFTVKADNTGIQFSVPYRTERKTDSDGTTNEKEYSVSASYYFEIVKI